MFSRKSLWRPIPLGWTTSLVLHLCCAALILAEAWALVSLTWSNSAPKSPTKVITMAGGWAPLPKAEESLPLKLEQNVPLSKPHTDQSIPPSDPELKPTDAATVSNSALETMVRSAVASAQEKSDEENQKSLEELTGTLNRVSSEESLDGLVEGMNRVFQTKPRATAPAAEPVAGEFDFETAQIHDVTRDELPDGHYLYTAILLDAEGRTLKSELDEAEGARVYEVMALIKKNPLLEQLYRGLLMGLFDQMMKGDSNLPNIKLPAPPNDNEATTTDDDPPTKPNDPQPGVPFDPFAE